MSQKIYLMGSGFTKPPSRTAQLMFKKKIQGIVLNAGLNVLVFK